MLEMSSSQSIPEQSWSREQKLLVRSYFKLRVHEAKGTQYEDLYVKIMNYRYPGDFIPIAPYGNVGDRKNDGYRPSGGLYSQVYAPNDPEHSRSIVTAAKKAQDDFDGLKDQWHQTRPIQQYRFVFNDAYRGCPPDVALACEKIAQDHEIESIPFLAKDLEDELMQLAEDQILEVIGAPIPETHSIPSIDYEVLSEVISHVLDNPVAVSQDSKLIAPEFNKKIQFNGLCSVIGDTLRTAARQTDAIDDYFELNSAFAKQELRDKLNAIYHKYKSTDGSDDRPTSADLAFWQVIEEIIPDQYQSQTAYIRAQSSAFVVVAYYFESCDVFESP